MSLIVHSEFTQPFETADKVVLEKIIHTVLYYSGFYSRFILASEFDEKRLSCELTNKIATIVVDNFKNRVDPDRDDTYGYCLRDVEDSDLGKIVIVIAQTYFKRAVFTDNLSFRLAVRKILYELDGRLSRRVDDFFPLFSKPISA